MIKPGATVGDSTDGLVDLSEAGVVGEIFAGRLEIVKSGSDC